MKKLISCILAASMALSTAPLTLASALGTEESGEAVNFEYVVASDKTATITGYISNLEQIDIPSEIGGYHVTGLELSQAATNNTTLTLNLGDNINNVVIGGSGDNVVFGALRNINVAASSTSYCAMEGILFNKAKSELVFCPPANAATNFTTPAETTNINCGAFRGNKNIEQINIGAAVNSIGESGCMDDRAYGAAFAWATMLENIIVSGGNVRYSSQDGVLLDRIRRMLAAYPAGKKNGSYTVPNGYTGGIANYAFAGNTNLKFIAIPGDMQSIGYGAFSGCRSDLTILSTSGSAAESFAKDNNINFAELTTAKGDVNGDSVISMRDVTTILQGENDLITLTAAQTYTGDMNDDGLSNLRDCSIIQGGLTD